MAVRDRFALQGGAVTADLRAGRALWFYSEPGRRKLKPAPCTPEGWGGGLVFPPDDQPCPLMTGSKGGSAERLREPEQTQRGKRCLVAAEKEAES